MKSSPSNLRAFSLVELLVVIAVIAIIAAIAIPTIADVSGSANAAKSRRNAQNVASLYNAAVAAGYPSAASDVPSAIDAVTVGISVVVGKSTNQFKVDELSSDEKLRVQDFLAFNSTNLTLIYLAPTN